MTTGRPLLFYNDWPLGYVNHEGERKARAFAAAGYDVTWMTGAGTRNPRLARIGKLVSFAARALRERAPAPPSDPHPLRSSSLLLLAPRQRRHVRRLNVAWTRRQLRAAIPRWSDTVAWVRHATPELVDALQADPPALVVYEVIDAHHEGPGMTGVWRDLFEDAERRLVALADLVVVTNAPLIARYEAQGVEVHFVPHGVDPQPWRPPPPAEEVVLGFLGVLDGRLDIAVLRHVARSRPDWRIRLIGPVQAGFDPAELADLSNVSIESPVDHSAIGEVLAGFSVGLLAYADSPVYRGMSPLKLLEMLAVGRPVVARPNPSVTPLEGLVRLASSPQEFVAQVQAALAEDAETDVQARRLHAASRSWSVVTDQLLALLADARPD